VWGVICRIIRVEFGFAACFRREEVMRVGRGSFLCVKAELGGRSVSMREDEGEGMRGGYAFLGVLGAAFRYCVSKWGVSI